jgi:hypothetical protein
MRLGLMTALFGFLARSPVAQFCPLQVDRVKPNGMFEFHITLHNPSESPIRLVALHVTYTTLTGSTFKKERRELVSPFRPEGLIIWPHQRMTLTTLPTMDAIAGDPARAFASCALLSPTGKGERVGE